MYLEHKECQQILDDDVVKIVVAYKDSSEEIRYTHLTVSKRTFMGAEMFYWWGNIAGQVIEGVKDGS